MSVCRACGREIRFIRTETDKTLPVDPGYVHFIPGGGPDTFISQEGKIIRGRRGRSGVMRGYVPHWVTCGANAGREPRKQ